MGLKQNLRTEEQINTAIKVVNRWKAVTAQQLFSASIPATQNIAMPPTQVKVEIPDETSTQTKATSPSSIEALSPTQLKEANHMQIQSSHPQQSRDAPPTQVIVQIPDETPTQISVLNGQPVPPPRIPLKTENKAPYPVTNSPYPIDSPHEIPIAGKF